MMRLEGKALEKHLWSVHGILGIGGDQAAKDWHTMDHKFGAKHQHEEARQAR